MERFCLKIALDQAVRIGSYFCLLNFVESVASLSYLLSAEVQSNEPSTSNSELSESLTIFHSFHSKLFFSSRTHFQNRMTSSEQEVRMTKGALHAGYKEEEERWPAAGLAATT